MPQENEQRLQNPARRVRPLDRLRGESAPSLDSARREQTSTDTTSRRRVSVVERFLSYVSPEPNTGCHLWAGAIHRDGYGAFGINGRTAKVHRFAYERHVGPIPAGLTIDHLCRNKCCVNPAHLEAVTPSENSRRAHAAQTHCKRGHEFTPENTYRWTSREGHPCRECLACRAERKAAYENALGRPRRDGDRVAGFGLTKKTAATERARGGNCGDPVCEDVASLAELARLRAAYCEVGEVGAR